MYRIGLFSKINRVSIKTLRYYDEVGLLKSVYVDEENGYRYYTSDQFPRLHQIIALRQIGFSIEEIQSILNSQNVEGIFWQRKAELNDEIEKSKQQMLKIEHYLDAMQKGFNMSYQVAIKDLPEVIVYSKYMTIPNYDYYFEVVPSIGEKVLEANPGIQCTVPPYCFIIYHDGEYRERDINVELCEAVTEWGNETEDIKFKKIDYVPEAACLYHKGPFRTLGSSYAYLFKWINDNGYTPCQPPRESYIDGIWNKDDENDWLTEIQVPVVKNRV